MSQEDSLGNKQVINDNEVEWINAGRGIIHSEVAGKEWVARGGRFVGVQLWINLPKVEKMNTPHYQPLKTKDILLVEKEGVSLRLVSGEHDGKKGPARSNVFTAMMQMKLGSDYSFNFPLSHNVLVYILEGEILVNDIIKASQHDLIYFEHEDGLIILEAFTDAALLILSGEPINEPLVSHGLFVMTSQTKILEAMKDYSQEEMEYLY
jgi:redox-sensitive bicupin YhaK (pirin superfamily)